MLAVAASGVERKEYVSSPVGITTFTAGFSTSCADMSSEISCPIAFAKLWEMDRLAVDAFHGSNSSFEIPSSFGESVLPIFPEFAEWGEPDIRLKRSAAIGEQVMAMGCSSGARNPLFRYLISSEAFRILVAHLAHTLLDSATFFSQEKPSSVTRSARRHFSTPVRLEGSNKFSVETLRLKSP